MLHSHKKRNEIVTFAETCMDLEIVVQIEMSEKKKIYKITYIWNLEKLYR